MPLPKDLDLNRLTPAKLWSALDEETRLAAAQSLYRGTWDDPDGRRESDAAIAAALRFRPVAVRRMPVEKRVGYLLRAVRPGDSLASSLLLALHIDRRSELLERFLGRLEIPQEGGVIDPDHDVQPPGVESLRAAAAELRRDFDPEQV